MSKVFEAIKKFFARFAGKKYDEALLDAYTEELIENNIIA